MSLKAEAVKEKAEKAEAVKEKAEKADKEKETAAAKEKADNEKADAVKEKADAEKDTSAAKRVAADERRMSSPILEKAHKRASSEAVANPKPAKQPKQNKVKPVETRRNIASFLKGQGPTSQTKK